MELKDLSDEVVSNMTFIVLNLWNILCDNVM